MYRELVINAPKEMLEYPDYSYVDCFENTPKEKRWWPDVGEDWKYSYCPREILFIYLKQRVMHYNMHKNIQFLRAVRNVVKVGDKFEVTTIDLPSQQRETRTFDFVIVCNGHYSTPNMPSFPGIDQLQHAEVIHSHDFKKPYSYKDKNVLILGGSYSAEDIASMVWKFGAKHVYVSSIECELETAYGGWPKEISFHKALKEIRVKPLADGKV